MDNISLKCLVSEIEKLKEAVRKEVRTLILPDDDQC